MIKTKDLIEFMKNRIGRRYRFFPEETKYIDEIVAILKNQPTITEKDIKGWACEAWDRVGDSLGYAEEHIEDVMKEMLTEIGVSICPKKSTALDKEEK